MKCLFCNKNKYGHLNIVKSQSESEDILILFKGWAVCMECAGELCEEAERVAGEQLEKTCKEILGL